MTIKELKAVYNVSRFDFYPSTKEGWFNAWINYEKEMVTEDGEIVIIKKICVGIHADVANNLTANPDMDTLDFAELKLHYGEKAGAYGLTQIAQYNSGPAAFSY